jgi:hypothetical protein
MKSFLARITPIDLGLKPSHPIVIPPDAIAPGVPTHPIYLPPYPDQGLPTPPNLPEFPPYPDNTLPVPERPVDPGYGIEEKPPRPDNTLPGEQPYPDQGLPGPQPRPEHPIVYPPEINNGLPVTPGLPPIVPEPPIVLPPDLPAGSILVVPVPGGDELEPPEHAPPGSFPAIAMKPGYLPMLVWVPPMAQPKRK